VAQAIVSMLQFRVVVLQLSWYLVVGDFMFDWRMRGYTITNVPLSSVLCNKPDQSINHNLTCILTYTAACEREGTRSGLYHRRS